MTTTRKASSNVMSNGVIFLLMSALLATALACTIERDADVYVHGADAIRLSQTAAARTWPGMATLGDGFVVIDGDREVAVCMNSAPGFEPLRSRPLKGCPAFFRPRQFPPAMQASLGMFGAEETVLVAPPALLGQSVTEWQLLFVHERFHQWQSTLPDYHERIAALDLAGDDQTGMWMLTYPFPYDDPNVGADFRQLSLALAEALLQDDGESFESAAAAYPKLRSEIFGRLDEQDRHYAEFQLWKEGAARWTEISVGAGIADGDSERSGEFRQLAAAIAARELATLAEVRLAEQRRGIFYAIGAMEWALVDRVDPRWRDSYGAGSLAVEPFLARARHLLRHRGPETAAAATQ
ncbi:MAG: hypothetical protein AAFZ58_08130 [Pseudomonadota bacterium]